MWSELFKKFEIECSKIISVLPPSSVPDLSYHKDIFQNQPVNVNKIIRKETIFINGKKHIVRRVYLRAPHAIDYRNIGWVLYCDIHSCMICCKSFPRIVGKHFKKHCILCGNIVCSSCLVGNVRVKELNNSAVAACSYCFFGQVCIYKMKIYIFEVWVRMKYHSQQHKIQNQRSNTLRILKTMKI